MRLTDLARSGWDVHELATFAGRRNVDTTKMYVHLTVGNWLSAWSRPRQSCTRHESPH